MDLFGLLAWPACAGTAVEAGENVHCPACGGDYPIVNGTPIMMRDGKQVAVVHEAELKHWDGYVPLVQQIFDSLGPDQVALDLGAGNRHVTDQRIILSDIVLTDNVDVVADAHHLPFRDCSFDFVYATAVFEHLRRPWVAAKEINRILKPGGNAWVDCAFVYPFHGYPAVYFNASVEGMRELFSDLIEVETGVAPWQMPSFAVEGLLSQYYKYFKPESDQEREFVDLLTRLDTFPLRDFDRRFSQADAARIAAATTYLGMKPLEAEGPSSVPPVVMHAWKRDDELQARYRNPGALVSSIADERIDSLLVWARTEGVKRDPAIGEHYATVEPFRKR